MNRQARGLMLPSALGALAILLVFLIALNYQKTSARAVLTASEVALEADIATRNSQSTLGQALKSQPIIGGPTLDLTDQPMEFEAGQDTFASVDDWSVKAETEVYLRRADPAAAEKLFTGLDEAGGYPEAAAKEKLQGARGSFYPWVTRSLARPDSSDGAKAGMSNRVHDSTFHAGFGYAALAPEGSVELESVVGWPNPTHKQAKDLVKSGKTSQELVTGLPVKVAAKKNVTVNKFPHGEVYSETGKISVKEGGVIGFGGFFPIPKGNGRNSYPHALKTQIEAARSALRANAVDKTDLIFGRIGISTIVKLFTGKLKTFPDNILTLETAIRFPMPMLFQIAKGKGILIWLYIHPAIAPDQNLEGLAKRLDNSDKVKETMKKLSAAKVKLGRLQRELAALGRKRAGAKKKSERARIDKDIKKKKNQIRDTEAEIKRLEEKLKGASKESKNLFESSIANGKIKALTSATETVAEENQAIASLGLTKKKGWKGWSYVQLVIVQWSKIGKLVVDISEAIVSGSSFDIDSLMGVFSTQTRLVHLAKGRPEPLPDKMFAKESNGLKPKHFAYRGTLTVPRGRTFRLKSGLALEGDLWIGRGGSAVIDGDLNLSADSNASAADPLKGKGRLYLEEGATLVVGGDVAIAGDAMMGSVLIGSPVGKEHPITSAILCQGSVELEYGTRPGVALDDLAGYIEDRFNVSGAREPVRVAIAEVAPNAAKIAGPFQTRVCYFAQYATSIGFPKAFPVPLPIPRPDKKNKMVPIFRILTMGFTTHLNLTLGENLVTASPWWIIGNNRTPMVPKIDPDALKNHVIAVAKKVKKLASNVSEMEKAIKNLAEDVAKKIIKEVVKQMIKELAEALVLEFLNNISPVAGYVASSSGALDKLGEEMDKFVDDNYDKVVGPTMKKVGLDGDYNGSLDSLVTEVKSQVTKRSTDVLLRETPGVFIYAGNQLSIGQQYSDDLLATGFFVAGNDIEIYANYTVGCMVSLKGDITAGKVLYNPYFTRASLYLPKKLKLGGTGIASNSDHWENAVNYKYGKSLDATHSGTKSLPIGPSTYRVTAEGWRRQ